MPIFIRNFFEIVFFTQTSAWMQLFILTNCAQSFEELFLRCSAVSQLFIALRSFFSVLGASHWAFMWIKCLSPEWNWIPCSITTAHQQKEQMELCICCVVAVLLILHCQLHFAVLLLNTDFTGLAHSSTEAWNRLLPYRSSPRLTSKGQDQSSHLLGMWARKEGCVKNGRNSLTSRPVCVNMTHICFFIVFICE